MKAILVHLASSVFAVLSALFVIGDNSIDAGDRALCLVWFFVCNIIAVLINMDNEFYGKN